MEGKSKLEGCWKLSQIKTPETGSSKTRLPESRIRAVVLAVGEVIFEDQMMVLYSSKTTRFPSLEMVKIPEVLLRGVSLLATHTRVCMEI